MPADPALAILSEALARLEYKVDLLMREVGIDPSIVPMMEFIGRSCPACGRNIEYQVDVQNQVVKVVCGCKTGKQPSVIPLFPVPGAPNGAAADAGRAASPGAEEPPADGRRRQGR